MHIGPPTRVSIVTISFNQARFLEETIRSVLDQKCVNVEYIIADGGSTDGSIEIINRYRPYLAKVLIGPDSGPADALNRGFAHATGDVWGFVNSDDTLLPGALQAVAEFMSENKVVDLVSGHCLVTDAEGSILRKTYSDRLNVRRLAYDGCILLQPATYFRSELFRGTAGFNVVNRVSWDAELFLDFGLTGARHALLNRFLASYRLHQESITGANSLKAKREATRDRNLARYLGRPPTIKDVYWRWFYRYLRKIGNPRDTWQRVINGPIGGRFASPTLPNRGRRFS
jgi:glycosyltransferase involved in cell wall biosynthesis